MPDGAGCGIGIDSLYGRVIDNGDMLTADMIHIGRM